MEEVNLRKRSPLTRKILRALRIERGFVNLLNTEEENMHIIPPNYNGWKESEATLLEAERKKAEALMDWQRRRIIC